MVPRESHGIHSPVNMYSKVAPNAYKSEDGWAAPLNCSGAMYPYVPMMVEPKDVVSAVAMA